MFHHTYPRSSPSLDPRAKYLAAVAEAKAAEAEFLAAEAQQRALRRLQEIHLAEQPVALRSMHGLGDLIPPFDTYGNRPAYYGHDRLASLRRQIEEEERRQFEEEQRLVVALQAELARESRRRQDEEQARLLLASEKGKHAAHLRERLARAVQHSHQQVSQSLLLSFIWFLTRCRSHLSSSTRGPPFMGPSKQQKSPFIPYCKLF